MAQSIQLLLLCFLTMVLSSCGGEFESVDTIQRKVNEEAFRTRFNREIVAEETSGIRLSPRMGNGTSTIDDGRVEFKWKTILMTGDDSISAFDNARIKLNSMFLEFGVRDSIQLSRASKLQVGGVRATTIPNLEKAARDLKVEEGDGCLIHMTSHGKPTGFYIRGQDYLTPDKLNQIVKGSCGNQPTVLLISACYSGVFAEPNMEADNRIILTAARKDKTSFGCSPEAEYTYWDGCLIKSLETSVTWFELAQQVEKCIERKEAGGGFARSYPQARFGADVKSLPIRN